MRRELFKGSCTALITPFTNNGVDLKGYRKLIDFQIEGGTSAILSCGTTGEPSTMTENEMLDTISCAVEHTAGRAHVVAGAGGNDTQKVISLARKVQARGANSLLIVTPYYNKTTQKGLIAHFTAVADSVNIPIIVYNVPSRTALNLLPETMARLAEHQNIAGIKESSGDLRQIAEMTHLLAGKAALFSGDDWNILATLAVGGEGIVSVASNIVPRMVSGLCADFFAGDIAAARQKTYKLNALVKALFVEVSPIPVKTAARLMGLPAGALRLPLVEMEEKNLEYLKREMRAAGIEL